MAKKLTPKFKYPGHRLNVGGQNIDPSTITKEFYDAMVAKGPGFADHFDLVDEQGNVIVDEPDAPVAVKETPKKKEA